jgi:adenine-specific DNA-methyltransferase
MSKELGQYFTIDDNLQQYVFDRVKNRGSTLLEPSFGAGHLLKKFLQFDKNYPMFCFEIDDSIESVVSFDEKQNVEYCNFLTKDFDCKFKTIIGNPPYVKHSHGNLYIDFTKKCFELLDDEGELIFIVPSDFIKVTSASSVINEMAKVGTFTDFLFPHNENLFNNASVDVVVFRYQKGLINNKSVINDEEKYCNVIGGVITFSDEQVSGELVSNVFDVYVGLVSGKDEIYKVPFGNVDILTDRNDIEKFIFVREFPTPSDEINNHLLSNKEQLISRRIKKFNEKNWFEWGAPRNLKTIESNLGKPCVYVRNITRRKEVAFKGNVTYFGGKLLCLIPKSEVDIDKIVEYLNSESFKKDYTYSGRFKIGHRQLSLALLSI